MSLIPEERLKYLLEFKYNTTGYSVLDYKMNLFWESVVKLMPLWLAPNLITVLGTIGMAVGYASMALYDVTFEQQVPSSVLVLGAFGIFLYQTLDAIDGKQARRTGSSSPLGFLFDHGCDSLTTTLMVLMIGQGTGLGLGMNMLLVVLGALNAFYMATWEEYHTHCCRTHFYNWGVTETQLSIISILLVSASFGNGIWRQTVFVKYGLEINLGDVIIACNFFLGVICMLMMLVNTLQKSKRKLHAVMTLLPLYLMNLGLVLYYVFGVYQSQGMVVMLMNGFMFSLLCSKLIISSVSKMDYPIIHIDNIVFLSYFIEEVTLSKIYLDMVDDKLKLFGIALFITLHYFYYVTRISRQIAGYLGINIFSIKPKQT